jgi:transposase
VETRFANIPPCLTGMEACVGAHHLSRRLRALGHDARLMPAKYVRPYSKDQKNDFRDAEAIAEAVQRPTMKFVATKIADQLDLQALHRVRERLIRQRTAIINQICAFLSERGILVRQGLRSLRAELPGILATRCEALSARMVHLIEGLAGDWRRLDERIEALSGEIDSLARQDAGCERLMSVPGIGSDYLQRDGGGGRRRGCVRQGPRLRSLAGAGPEADLHGVSHDPGQDIQARQSLPARAVRSSRLGRLDQAKELGALRA